MKPFLIDLITAVSILVIVCLLYSLYAMRKRQKLLQAELYQIPLPSELRKQQVPVIESIPFWVPDHISDAVDIEIQPSMKSLSPKFSTPKLRRKQLYKLDEKPQLKFAVKYNASRSTLVVDLLESKNVGQDNLVHDTLPSLSQDSSESSFLSGLNVFQAIELTPRRKDQPPVIRRTRKNSFEIEMDYEELQLQLLQFSVMTYDEYSRQKVLGDVVLPMAKLASQGLDITRELIMWRDVQIEEQRSRKKQDDSTTSTASGVVDTISQDIDDESKCSPS